MICEKCGRTYNDFRAVCLCGNSLIPGFENPKNDTENGITSKFIVTPYKDGVEITSYSSFEKVDSLNIPSFINGLPVRKIGESAFMDTEFVYVTIPSSVFEIGKNAFHSCEKLKKVVFSEGLLKLGGGCFSKCNQLKELRLPDSVECIEHGFFSSIKEFICPKNLKKIPSFFCYGDIVLKKIVFNEGLEEIEAFAFNGSSVNNIIIPKSVKRIGIGAFDKVTIAFMGQETEIEWDRNLDVDHPSVNIESTIYCLDGSKVLAFCRKNKFNAFPLSDYGKKNEKNESKTLTKSISKRSEAQKPSQHKKKTNNSDKKQIILNETVIPYEDRYSKRSRLLLVDKKYKEYSLKEPEKEKYKYLWPIENINNGTAYKVCGIEKNKVYLIFDKERIVTLSSFEKLEEHIEKITSDYIINRNAYVEKIISLGEQLRTQEAGLIAQNLAETLPLELLLDHESLSQFDNIIVSMIGEIDYHINDVFFLSTELYRNTYLSKFKSKTQQNEIKKYQFEHKKIWQWKYNELFDNIHIVSKADNDVDSLYSNYFAKYLDYIRQYYSSNIEGISKEFSKTKYPTKYKDKKIISIYIAYYILKSAIFEIAKKEYDTIIVENCGSTIRKYSTILKDKFEGGFINTRTKGAFVLALMKNGVFDSDDYIENYNKFEAEFSKLQQKNDIEKFREKFASKGVLKTYTLKDIDLMTGIEFENFLCDLFQKMGYHTLSTKASGDQGIDVIAEKDSIKIGIQAKCYTGTVGNSAIQEAVAGKTYYSCDKVMVITNSRFTKAAMDLAKSNNVILWDRDTLKENL